MFADSLIWSFIGLTLTLLIFSYLAGDNVLFRIVIYAFIGISAAYVTLIVTTQVLWQRIVVPILTGSLTDQVVALIGLVLCALLTMKLIPRLSSFGNLPMGFLVGVGAAVAIGGALTGTLIPQVLTMLEIDWLHQAIETNSYLGSPAINGIMTVLGTLATLAYFQYGAKQSRRGKIHRGFLVESLAWVGKIVIAISFGAIFAGVLSAAISAMVERVSFMINLLRTIGG